MSYSNVSARFVSFNGDKTVSASSEDGRLLQVAGLVAEHMVENFSATDAPTQAQALANIVIAAGGRESGLGSRIFSTLTPQEQRLAEPLL